MMMSAFGTRRTCQSWRPSNLLGRRPSLFGQVDDLLPVASLGGHTVSRDLMVRIVRTGAEQANEARLCLFQERAGPPLAGEVAHA